MNSINQVAAALKAQHIRFIEAGYHIHHERLIEERRMLMEEGTIISRPWVGATPSYLSGSHYAELDLPNSVIALLQTLSQKELVFDRPLLHQAHALEAFFSREKELIISTGTGSGKTEGFLYSILGMLAVEGHRAKTPSLRGVRSIILYPMNALVADQLARFRLLLGSEAGSSELERRFGRTVQFGMYTSRTPYHGLFDTRRNDSQVRPVLDYYCNLQRDDPALFSELKRKGRIPSKDLLAFRNKGKAKESQFRTHAGDAELFTRQEMNQPNDFGGAPDILITNYSMLEYMLLRPIEQGIFDQTRAWLAADDDNKVVIVLDESHLYRGAQGAEVALLLRRLLQRLDISSSRVRYILSSASLGSDEDARQVAPSFAASLTGTEAAKFEVITGERKALSTGSPGSVQLANALEAMAYEITEQNVRRLGLSAGWPELGNDEFVQYLASHLPKLGAFHLLQKVLYEGPRILDEVSKLLFADAPQATAFEATGNLLHLASVVQGEEGQTLMASRLHVFVKGLPRQYVCINPRCPERRATNGVGLLGRMYIEPRPNCGCGARVFELLTHRTCGAAYIRAFRDKRDRDGQAVFLWTEGEVQGGGRGIVPELEELHILVEEPRSDPDPTQDGMPLSLSTPFRFLDIRTGHLVRAKGAEGPDDFIKVWVPGKDQQPTEQGAPWSWRRCPACGITERAWKGQTGIMDLETKGEDVFANAVKTIFRHQPTDPSKARLPNQGRKVLCFSDSRQKAATLARDLQRLIELDSFREVIVAVRAALPPESNMNFLFPAFTSFTGQRRIGFFDDGDQVQLSDGSGYVGSRSRFVGLQKEFEAMAARRNKTLEQLVIDRHAAEELNADRPWMYNQSLLRLLGHQHFSIFATLVGFLRPTWEVLRQIASSTRGIPNEILNSILLESLHLAAQRQAYDPRLSDRDRRLARGYARNDYGLLAKEIIPDHLREKCGSETTPTDWDCLLEAILYPEEGEKLFTPLGNAKYAVNPGAVTLQLALDHQWRRCLGCRQFSGWDIRSVCPREGCQGTTVPLELTDLHLQARNSLFREPCLEVITGEHSPFTLRAEEHSAQLSAKDQSEVFSKTERYELLFQDVLIGETRVEQPVDVLSCTTTMEVGIDIGSLTAVAMRTVPPRPENYQQRSGRAGRRGVGLSTIVTFADNSPHETHYFRNPQLLISAAASLPIIYTGNRKIAERHINASLLERFFDPKDMDVTADVFRSLGSGLDFFAGSGRYSLSTFESWLNLNVLAPSAVLADLLGDLLPSGLYDTLPEANKDWRRHFVQQSTYLFLAKLHEIASSSDWTTANPDLDLLSTLLDAALLPTFSFPIDTCNFVVRELQKVGNTRRIKTSYEMSQGLSQALSTYVPGRQLVVDKKTFTSYGLFFPFASDRVNRATTTDWANLSWLNFCPVCETVVDESVSNLQEASFLCEVCGQSILESRHIYRPQAFAPEIEPQGEADPATSPEEERVYATRAKFPIPPRGSIRGDSTDTKPLGGAEVRRMKNEQLMVVNLGVNNSGFYVCTSCGAVGRDAPLENPHNRPYPRDFQVQASWPLQCTGTFLNTTFGFRFPTDLAVLRIPMRHPLIFAPNEQWFQSASQSLAEALVLGAARALALDRDELSGGLRFLPTSPDADSSTQGFLEVFLHDTTPGGAGFASAAFDHFDEVLQQARAIMLGCDCAASCPSCLRTYENRLLHELLDRTLGRSLLEYAFFATIPNVESHVEDSLVDRLSLTLRLMAPEVSIAEIAGFPRAWLLRANGSSLTFNLRSCLVESEFAGGALAESISDFAINKQLPQVAIGLIDRLRPTT